jgi:hypothetical protein
MFALNVFPSTSTLPNALTGFVLVLQTFCVHSTVKNLASSLAGYIKCYDTGPTANLALLCGSCTRNIKSNLLAEFRLHIFNLSFDTRVFQIHFHHFYH